jgi:hypothetical protein
MAKNNELENIETFNNGVNEVSADITNQYEKEKQEDELQKCEKLKEEVCDSNSNSNDSYAKKIQRQEELEDDREFKQTQKKLTFLGKLAKQINENIKKIPSSKTVLEKSKEKIKDFGKNLKESAKDKIKSSSLLQFGLFYGALKGIQKFSEWYDEVSKEGIGNWLWEKTKDFFTSENFIYKLVWGEDGTGNKSGLWFKIKDFFTSENFIYKLFWGEDGSGNKSGLWFEVKNYFKTGEALNDIIKVFKTSIDLTDMVFEALLGKHYINSKKWVQKQLTSILDWWDEVQSTGGLWDWINLKIYEWFASSKNSLMKEIAKLIKPASVEKQEMRIAKQKEELKDINENIEKENQKKKQEYIEKRIKYQNKIIKENKERVKSGKKVLDLGKEMAKFDKKNPKPVDTPLLKFEEYQEISNSTRYLQEYSKYANVLKEYNKQYNTENNIVNSNVLKNNAVIKNNEKNIDFSKQYSQNVKNVKNISNIPNIQNISNIENNANAFIPKNTLNINENITTNVNSLNSNIKNIENIKNKNKYENISKNTNIRIKNQNNEYAKVLKNKTNITNPNITNNTDNVDNINNVNVNENTTNKIQNKSIENVELASNITNSNIKNVNIYKKDFINITDNKISNVNDIKKENYKPLENNPQDEIIKRGFKVLNDKIEAKDNYTVQTGFLGSIEKLEYA